MLILVIAAAILVLVFASLWAAVRRRSMGKWLPQYVREVPRRRAPRAGEPVHLLLCVADHFEPGNGGAPPEQADQRVRTWLEKYPALFADFHDADGRPPQHSFFYPVEQYNRRHVEMIARLCAAGFGEVEIHLHHDNDTADNLQRTLLEAKRRLGQMHGLLSRRRDSGQIVYGFVHGNWALDNSRPDGRRCGVNNELQVLHQTGCYADFTLPSAPDACQTRQINSIYYAVDDPRAPKSHDRGPRVGTVSAPAGALMLIQGPLLLNWQRRKWGLLPKVENGCLQATQPPTPERIDLWLKARVQVPSRPDWFFVKLHSHGAPEANQSVVLGAPMCELHRELGLRADRDPTFRFHYVTAREMYNLARAAEAGWGGSVAGARDFELVRGLETPSPHSATFRPAAGLATGG